MRTLRLTTTALIGAVLLAGCGGGGISLPSERPSVSLPSVSLPTVSLPSLPTRTATPTATDQPTQSAAPTTTPTSSSAAPTESASVVPSITADTATPTTTSAKPTPTPTPTTPAPTSTPTTASATPTSASPTPKPTSATPTPTPTSESPSATPTSASPSPSATAPVAPADSSTPWWPWALLAVAAVGLALWWFVFAVPRRKWDAAFTDRLSESRWVIDSLVPSVTNRALSPEQASQQWIDGKRRIDDLQRGLYGLGAHIPGSSRAAHLGAVSGALAALQQSLERDVAVRGMQSTLPDAARAADESLQTVSHRRDALMDAVEGRPPAPGHAAQ